LIKYRFLSVNHGLYLWDKKVALAELLLGNYRHPLAIGVETDLLGKFVLI
jgi:hypothetical protein